MSEYLKNINTPADLKSLSPSQLPDLCAEIRQEILEVVSRNGGHLASSLGVVELTVALYYVFDLPRDKVVWDVGHQAYAHKILTGRRDQFRTLRQYSGISGFPRRAESPYDFFGVGHASTSLSAALGMAVARDRKGEDEKIIACIGDGALTGGLALEALNQGGMAKNTLTVLNANEMAISPSVGALSEYLSRLISAPSYNKLKQEVEFLLKKIPAIGSRVIDSTHRLEEALKGLITPGQIFEEFGYRYIGPIPGHDVQGMVRLLSNIKPFTDPVLLHVLTTKGKGYRFAEKNPEKFHGTGPFSIETGKGDPSSGLLSYSEVFGRSLVELAEKTPEIVAITAAMASGTGLKIFAERFPERFFDVGIAEGHALTFAAGMASRGLRPVAAIYSTFLQRAYDQVIHDICLQGLPVVLAIDRAGLVGEDGPTHHGVFDISFLRNVPNLTIMQPRNGADLPAFLAAAFKHDGPVVLRYPRGKTELKELPRKPEAVPFGRARVVRPGKDGMIWSLGEMIAVAEEAAELLSARGLDYGVVDTRFIKPIDAELLKSQAEEGKIIVTVEEHVLAGGLGTAIWESLEGSGRGEVSLLRIGISDRFVPHGSIEKLREECGLTPAAIAGRVENFSRSNPPGED